MATSPGIMAVSGLQPASSLSRRRQSHLHPARHGRPLLLRRLDRAGFRPPSLRLVPATPAHARPPTLTVSPRCVLGYAGNAVFGPAGPKSTIRRRGCPKNHVDLPDKVSQHADAFLSTR